MSAAAILPGRQNRWMQRFKDLGATSVETAIEPGRIHGSDGRVFKQMVSAGVFVTTSDGRLYLNPSRAEELVRARRARTLLVLAAGAALFLLFLWSAYR